MRTVTVPIPNPFVVGKDGTEAVCAEKYRRLIGYLRRNPSMVSHVLQQIERRARRRGRGRADPKIN